MDIFNGNDSIFNGKLKENEKKVFGGQVKESDKIFQGRIKDGKIFG